MAESTITKRAIADSLKELTRAKSFDKIGVVDITEKTSLGKAVLKLRIFVIHKESGIKATTGLDDAPPDKEIGTRHIIHAV